MGVRTVALFSVLLATVPLVFFSLVRRQSFDGVLASVFGSTFLDLNRVVIGGVLSVILVNLILFLFVFVAFVLEKPPPKRTKRAGDPTFGKERDVQREQSKESKEIKESKESKERKKDK
jgi:hypothetical protein